MEPMKVDDRAKLSKGEGIDSSAGVSRMRRFGIFAVIASAVVLSATFISFYLSRFVGGPQHDVKPTLLASSLNSYMVLQRDNPNEIFGWSVAPGASISVDFNGTALYTSSSSSTPDAEIYTHDSIDLYYRWSITLPPVPVTTFPSYLKVTSSFSEAAFAENILFGDVYICSGQSNMQMPAIFMFNYDDAVSDLPSSTSNRLRIFTVSQDDTQYYNGKPSSALATVTLDWAVATAKSVSSPGRGGFFGWSEFSAVW
jgi:sialate O-acetylesterase